MNSTVRTFTALAAAILLPLFIFVALQVAASYRSQSAAEEYATLERARRLIGAVDGEMLGVRAALRTLTTLRELDAGRFDEARSRAYEIIAQNPSWSALRLVDLEAGREIFDTSRSPDPDSSVDAETLGRLRAMAASVAFGNVAIAADGCVCVDVYAPVIRSGRTRYAFVLSVLAESIQSIALAEAPREGVTAVVDAKGGFIARTLNYRERAGKPATLFVRNAIREGASGVYAGETYEGLVNYTAFAKSPLTGWSAHVAVSSAVLDAPLRAGWTMTAAAALVSLALAAALAFLGMRTLAAQRLAAERLQQAARTESIGKLAGGMAHDFNNMLTIILGSLELAKRRLAAGRVDVARYLDNATEGAERAAGLTRKMLAFSRRQTLQPAPLDVGALMTEVGELLKRTLPPQVDVRLDLKATSHAFADPRELENAIIDLAVNARDAMPDGGVLTIATADVGPAKARAGAAAGASDEAVLITVSDEGVGMTDAVAARAFEPFFTTKDVGKGTGLGLSQVLGFAQQSGGDVTIESRPGRGTKVHITLPRSSGPTSIETKRDSSRGEIAGGARDELVLIVEDEERVLRSAVEALTELGYSVRHAADGIAALEILAAEPHVRLMFTDIVMPRLDGRALAQEAARLRPDLKILFATGHEREPAPPGQPWRVITKPYSFEELARNVRQTLDAA